MKKMINIFLSALILIGLSHPAFAEGTKKSMKITNSGYNGMWAGNGLGFVNQVGSQGALPTNLTAASGGGTQVNVKDYITTPPGSTATFSTSTDSSICSISGSGVLTASGTGTCSITVSTSKVDACMTCNPRLFPVDASTSTLTFAVQAAIGTAEQQKISEMGLTGVTDPTSTAANQENQVLNLTKFGSGITYKAYKTNNGAERYNGKYPANPTCTGSMADFNWAAGESLQGPVLCTGQGDFVAAQFEGYILWPGSFKQSTAVRFYDVCDDGYRFQVAQTAGANQTDFQTVIENYVDQAPGSWNSVYNGMGSTSRVAGSIYKFRMDYYEHGGHATCALYWSAGKSGYTWNWTTKILVPAANFAVTPTQWNK